jgi:acyl transferase domain-containing protein
MSYINVEAVGNQPFVVGLQVLIPECTTITSFLEVLHHGEVVTPDFTALRHLLPLPWSERKAELFATAIKIPTIFTFDREYFGITPADATLMDPQQRKLIEVAVNCFFDAGITPGLASGHTPVGCYVGAGVTNYLAAASKQSAPLFSEATRRFIANDLSALALRTSYFLNLQGPSLAILSTCSSSLVAFHHATQFVQSGQGHFAIAAGVNIDFATGQFRPEPEGILSRSNMCRPLSAESDGTYFSNGICVALLASENAVNTFKLTPYCSVQATGVNNDGRRKLGYAAPSIEGQASLIAAASQASGLTRRPDLIELHGTGTRIGDPIEMQALSQAYAPFPVAPEAHVGSVKSNFGHLNSSSGMLGLIKAAISLRHRKCFMTVGCIPLTEQFEFRGSGFSPAIEERPLCGAKPVCAINSFGIGGTNAHALLVGHSPLPLLPSTMTDVLFLIGTHSPTLMAKQLEMLRGHLDGMDSSEWRNFAYTCNLLFSREKYQAIVLYSSLTRQTITLGDLRELSFIAIPSRHRLLPKQMGEFLQDNVDNATPCLPDLRDLLICGQEERSLRKCVAACVPEGGISHEHIWGELLLYLKIALCDMRIARTEEDRLHVVNGIQKAFSDSGYLFTG